MNYKLTASVFYLTLGVIGACITLYGYLFQTSDSEIYYIIGSSALLVTALYYKLFYFVALEFILIADHLAAWFGSGIHTQISLPILLCLQLIIVYSMIGQSNLLFLIIGILGIALLSVGLSYHCNWLFFFGGLFIALYAYYNGYNGQKAAYLWAALNSIFTILALYHILLM